MRVRQGLNAERIARDHYQRHGFHVEGLEGTWTNTTTPIDGWVQGVPVQVKSINNRYGNVTIAEGIDTMYDQVDGLRLVAINEREWGDIPYTALWADIARRLTNRAWLEPSNRDDYGGRRFKVIEARWLARCIQCQ